MLRTDSHPANCSATLPNHYCGAVTRRVRPHLQPQHRWLPLTFEISHFPNLCDDSAYAPAPPTTPLLQFNTSRAPTAQHAAPQHTLSCHVPLSTDPVTPATSHATRKAPKSGAPATAASAAALLYST